MEQRAYHQPNLKRVPLKREIRFLIITKILYSDKNVSIIS